MLDISHSHSSDYKNCCLLGCDTMYSGDGGFLLNEVSCLDYTVPVANEQNMTVKHRRKDKDRGKLKHLKKKPCPSANLSTQTPHGQAHD